jgi:P-type conjugative transfer protein TrbJ
MAFPANVAAQFDMWSSTLGNASDKLARVLGVQQGQQLGYAELQAAAQVQSSTAAGQMQAIQAGNELTSLVSTQLNQMQTTITAWAQSETTHQLIEDDKTARMNGAETLFVQQAHKPPLTGFKNF